MASHDSPNASHDVVIVGGGLVGASLALALERQGLDVAMVEATPAARLPDSLKDLRTAIEKAVPHGRTGNGGKGDRGAWHNVPQPASQAWRELERESA